MKLKAKKPSSHDARWIEAILSKPWDSDPKTSHYECLNIGYLGGMENQRYADAKICARLHDQAETEEEREVIKKCFHAIMEQTIRKPK